MRRVGSDGLRRGKGVFFFLVGIQCSLATYVKPGRLLSVLTWQAGRHLVGRGRGCFSDSGLA